MIGKIKEFFGFSKRSDNWTNSMTNLGVNSSRVNSTKVGFLPLLDYMTLDEMYKSNGLAQKIVNIIVDDAMRGFIEADYDLLQEMSRIKLKQRITDGCYAGRLYGGALLVAFVDDGLELEKPVNLNRIDKIISIKVFDKSQVTWFGGDLNTNYGSEHFGEPEFYTINSYSNVVDVGVIKVHRSRCFLMNGATTTNRMRLYNGGWDLSIMQSCFGALRNYGIVTDSSAEIIQDFVQVIFKMDGLALKLIEEGGEAAIKKRLAYIDVSRSITNSLLIDAEAEDYEKRASSVAGLADLWDRFSEVICSVTGYPATKLFGRSPAGMNSTGDSDMKNYYDMVGAYRSDQVQPAIDWIVELLEHQKTWKNKPKTFDWEFPSLVSPSDLETAKIKKEYAEIDCMYIDRGAIDASQAWQQRFGQEKFNYNIKLDVPETDTLLEEEAGLIAELKAEKDKATFDNKESAKTKKIMDSLYQKISRVG